MPTIESTTRIIDHLLCQPAARVLRVGIDGIDAAGKTTFAGDLAELLVKNGRPVIRASLDDFHNPRRVRYQRGELSPEGFYLDSFNYPLLRTYLLDPLSATGTGWYRLKAFDLHSDSAIDSPEQQAPDGAILVFDGIFLQRPELAGCWDVVIFLKISFETCLERALKRDLGLWGSPEVIEQRYRERYFPAQKVYLETCKPEERADFVIENS